MRDLKQSELYAAMLASGNYSDHIDIVDSLEAMAEEIEAGADPVEVLHCEGFEPDYVFDLIDYTQFLLG